MWSASGPSARVILLGMFAQDCEGRGSLYQKTKFRYGLYEFALLRYDVQNDVVVFRWIALRCRDGYRSHLLTPPATFDILRVHAIVSFVLSPVQKKLMSTLWAGDKK